MFNIETLNKTLLNIEMNHVFELYYTCSYMITLTIDYNISICDILFYKRQNVDAINKDKRNIIDGKAWRSVDWCKHDK